MFWRGRSKKKDLTNRRLRVLYDLHCIDRYFPVVDSGSSEQHVVLDKSGAIILNIANFYKRDKLPFTYRHMILTTEFIKTAYNRGFGWGELEYKISGYSVDIYYEDFKIAVEIDVGTENHKTLKDKTKNYNRMRGLNFVIFVTQSEIKRGDSFIDNIHNKEGIKHKVRCNFEDLKVLTRNIKKMYNKS